MFVKIYLIKICFIMKENEYKKCLTAVRVSCHETLFKENTVFYSAYCHVKTTYCLTVS